MRTTVVFVLEHSNYITSAFGKLKLKLTYLPM